MSWKGERGLPPPTDLTPASPSRGGGGVRTKPERIGGGGIQSSEKKHKHTHAHKNNPSRFVMLVASHTPMCATLLCAL